VEERRHARSLGISRCDDRRARRAVGLEETAQNVVGDAGLIAEHQRERFGRAIPPFDGFDRGADR
jgi:hypothetical protein